MKKWLVAVIIVLVMAGMVGAYDGWLIKEGEEWKPMPYPLDRTWGETCIKNIPEVIKTRATIIKLRGGK